ncbi:AAA family ATPase [Tetraselmis virus 1]|uniref:AAA family ATPase n=1 Tax=Tetraselmis virus 1 TaxID=2060617 RepID=A0A2P0VN73_9VIRU|nr:AAA family ATPase [Tetraselmis virus 1]AUF82355.1 AAA family ATPase [Tetraselmis virus 1]
MADKDEKDNQLNNRPKRTRKPKDTTTDKSGDKENTSNKQGKQKMADSGDSSSPKKPASKRCGKSVNKGKGRSAKDKVSTSKRPPRIEVEYDDDDADEEADAIYELLQNAFTVYAMDTGPQQKKKTRNPENNPALSTYDAEHSKFYNSLTKEKKVRIAEMERTLYEASGGDGRVPKRFKLLESGVAEETKRIVMNRVEGLFRSDVHPAEKAKLSKWLDAFLRIPFGIVRPLPVTKYSPTEDIQRFVQLTKDKLDSNIYGHAEAKEQIIRTLAKWISNPNSKGNVIGVQGPMGCGKTTLVKKCIAEALGIPLVMIPLGGVHDSSLLTGHLYTYEGSTYGAVANCLMTAKCMNPVILLDELDKVGGETQKGQEVYNTLIHLTDPIQNDHFVDNYFADAPLDLSKALMVFTFNHTEAINPILRDRMTIINASGYNVNDKKVITTSHLLPNVCEQHGINDITISNEAIEEIIQRVPEEQGVRNIARAIETMVGNVNLKRILDNDYKPVEIDRDFVCHNITDKRSDKCSVSHIYL